MRVVVGKTKNPTPMMAAYIRFAALNPYWNVPPDLAAERIAPHVVKGGSNISRRSATKCCPTGATMPTVVDPATIDWKGVADGTRRDPRPAAARVRTIRWGR